MNVDENTDTITHTDPLAADESLSKHAVHIMNVTSGLCADPIYYHSYAAIGNYYLPTPRRLQLPTPKEIFASVFRKCIICHQRLGGAAGSGGGTAAAAAANAYTGGMLQCVACGVYAHRSCAFARPALLFSSSSSSSEGLAMLCVVNFIEIQKALGVLLLEDDNDKPTINTPPPPPPPPPPPATTMTSLTLQSTSSSTSTPWSLFGGSKKLTPMMDTTNNHDSYSETTVSTIAATSTIATTSTIAITATTQALSSNEEKQRETTTHPSIQSTTTTTSNGDINQPPLLSTSWTIANIVNGYTGKESYNFGDVTRQILFGKRVTTTTTNNSDIDDNDGGCSTIAEQQSNLIIIDNADITTAIDNNASHSSSSSTTTTSSSSSSLSWSILGNKKSSSLTEETKHNNAMNTDSIQATTETAVEEDECCRRDSIVTTTSTNATSSSLSSSWSIFGTTKPSTTTNSSSDGGRVWGERITSLSLEDNSNANNTLSQLVSKEINVTDEPTLPSSSSSWSIFGKKSVTTDDAMDDISPLNSICINKKDEINHLEEVNEPIINICKTNDEEQGSIITPGMVIVSTAATFATKTTTFAAKTTTSTIGTVVGGVAGFAIAGPVGSIVGSQIGRNISTVGITLVESGVVGLSYLVVDIAKAANFLPPPIRSIINSEQKKEQRELKLINNTLILVRPDVHVEPIWGEYATEARRLWEVKMQHHSSSDSSSSSSSISTSAFNNTNNASNDERNVRYQKDIDIIKAEAGELTMKDKVFLLVNRILNDKLSLPGYQYRYLILKHKRRTMFGTNDDNHAVPTADINNDNDNDQRSCRQDAHGIIKHITATLLEVRPGLASSSTMTEMTACAVETLIFLELYDDCFKEIILQMEEKDENLVAKIKALKKKNNNTGERATTLVNNHNSNNDNIMVPSTTTVSQVAILALQSLPPAHTPTEKLVYCVKFLEYISIHFSLSFHGKCIDADTMLLMVCQHILVANVPHLHAEVAFIEEFSRDEQLLCGKEGYALITLQASLHYLDLLEELLFDILPSMETEII